MEEETPETGWKARLLHVGRDWVLPILGILVLMQVFGWLRAPALPEEAPPFVLKDLSGAEVALADYEGKTVVLNFWATWCGPCRIEAPSFSRFASANPDIVVLGIAADGPAPKLKAAAKDLGITYTVLQGDRATLEAYGIDTFPTTVVVGPDGEVVTAHTGLMFRPQLWWATL
jgi:thiol-disulfide isomerase/thioredoxin